MGLMRNRKEDSDDFSYGNATYSSTSLEPAKPFMYEKTNYQSELAPTVDHAKKILNVRYHLNQRTHDIQETNYVHFKHEPEFPKILETCSIYDDNNEIVHRTLLSHVKSEEISYENNKDTRESDSNKNTIIKQHDDSCLNDLNNKADIETKNVSMRIEPMTIIEKCDIVDKLLKVKDERERLNDTIRSNITDRSYSSGLSSQVTFDKKVERENVKTSTPERQILSCSSRNKVKASSFCSFCDYKTNFTSDLVKHIRTVHDKVLNKFCQFCSFVTSRSDNLARHVKDIHRKETFFCNYCSFKCSRKDNLKVHMKLWHDGKDDPGYACKYCNNKYFYKQSLTRHIKSCKYV